MKILMIVLSCLLVATPVLAKTVNLEWDASPTPDVTGYDVCYTTIPGVLVADTQLPSEGMLPTCVDVGNVLTATIPALIDDVAYYFGVVAYNEVDQKSNLSNIVMSQGFVAPESASNLRGTSTVNTVDVPVQ